MAHAADKGEIPIDVQLSDVENSIYLCDARLSAMLAAPTPTLKTLVQRDPTTHGHYRAPYNAP